MNMLRQDRIRILITVAIAGVICVLLVILSAYAADLQYRNNKLIESNKALKGEVANLDVKIESINNIAHIEHVATTKLGMVYPKSGQCLYITEKDRPNADFAAVIRERAYN